MAVTISPFLALDEERRKRDQMLLEKMGKVGSSLVNVPITYDSMIKEQEDRARKIERDKQDLMIKMAQETRNSAKETRDVKKFEDSQEDRNKNSKKELISSSVAASLARGLRGKGAMQDLFDNPALSELDNSDEVEAEIARQEKELADSAFKKDIEQGKLDVQRQNAETKAKIAERKVRANSAKLKEPRQINWKPTDFQTKTLMGYRDKIRQLSEAQAYKDSADIDTGPFAGAFATLRAKLHMQNPQMAVLDAQNKEMINKYLKDTSGATVTDQEYERLKKTLPSVWDDEEVFQALTDIAIDMAARAHNEALDQFTLINTGRMGEMTRIDPKTGKTVKQGNPERAAYSESISKMTDEQLDARLQELRGKR